VKRLRPALNALYDAAAVLAALLMLGTLLMVLLGMLDRYLPPNLPAWLPLHLRGTDLYAGYCMAGAGFLALAHTLKKNEHIRVTLLLQALPPRIGQMLELFSLALAVLLAALLCFYSVRLSYQSWLFHDISTGNDATPLWLPQIGMALGTLVLLIALIDEAVLQWRGERNTPASSEALHNE
jgi:TRAP-type C4-dicarboxylate transport system permease small subunit